MSAIQNIFNRYGPEYLARYKDRMPQNHKKVIQAVQHCRSGAFGRAVYHCPSCSSTHVINCSCGNRHCPSCQQHKAQVWLETQLRKHLPCSYFFITITLPDELRHAVRSHQRAAYSALFSCAQEALKKLARDPRFVGTSRIGFLAVLHTWGGMLQFHPHLHLIVPAGGVSEDGSSWIDSRRDLFVHTDPLESIFKAKFRDAMEKTGLMKCIDPAVWRKKWVVHSEPAGNGKHAFRYLARYVFRVAISNNRIISYDNHTVTFRYKDKKRNKWDTMSLDAVEFIRRFLQHVLPTGFMKVRHYGFLNANSSVTIKNIRQLIARAYDEIIPEPDIKETYPYTVTCPRCGNPMKAAAVLRNKIYSYRKSG